MNKITKTILAAAALAAASFTSNATPIYFANTGSYYDMVSGNITWTDARTASGLKSYAGRSGRLATVSSQAENDFIVNNLLSTGYWGQAYWLGAWQPNGNNEAAAAGWQWINGESWSYTNWRPGEPNDGGTTPPVFENYLSVLTPAQNGQWNDVSVDNPYVVGYIVEYAAVPEPTALSLMSFASVGLLLQLRQNRSKNQSLK